MFYIESKKQKIKVINKGLSPLRSSISVLNNDLVMDVFLRKLTPDSVGDEVSSPSPATPINFLQIILLDLA